MAKAEPAVAARTRKPRRDTLRSRAWTAKSSSRAATEAQHLRESGGGEVGEVAGAHTADDERHAVQGRRPGERSERPGRRRRRQDAGRGCGDVEVDMEDC